MDQSLTGTVRRQLLQIAHESLRLFVLNQQFARPQLDTLSPLLSERRSSFVTIYRDEQLRGCIGSTNARRPLGLDVARNAAAAARDPRFPPVLARELPDLVVEISVLNPPAPLLYQSYQELLQKLRPGIDGVLISWQEQRALLLPQVWDRLPDPAEFLRALCRKARIPVQVLQATPPTVAVLTFEAYSFTEDDDEIKRR